MLSAPSGEIITPPSINRFPAPCYIKNGKAYLPAGDPDTTEDDLEFVGWNWNGSRIDFNLSRFFPTIAYQFYAVWKDPADKWITISFESGFEGVDSPPATELKANDEGVVTVQKPINYHPTHIGFRYTEDWFKLTDLQAIKSDFDYEKDWELVEGVEGEYRIFNHKVSEDTTYVLKWIKTWNVKFLDEEEKEIDNETIDNGKKAKDPAPKKDGFEYSWYYLDESGKKVTFDCNTESVTRNLELHIEWKAVDTVKYCCVYPNGRVGGTYTVTYSETENAEEFAAGSFKAAKFADTGFTAPDGYKFVGWKIVADDPTAAQQASTGEVGNQDARKKPALTSAAKARFLSRLADPDQMTEKEDNEPEIIKEGDPVDLAAHVYIVPVWDATPRVTYHTAYPKLAGIINGKVSFDDFTAEDTEFTVKTFDAAFAGTDYKVPAGYKFVGWKMFYSDVANPDDDDMPVVIGPGDQFQPEYPVDEKKAVDTEMKRAVRVVLDAASEKAEAEQANNSEVAVVNNDAVYAEKDDSTQGPFDVQPATTQDLHVRVDLYAVWEPTPTITYHTAYPGITGLRDGESTFDFTNGDIALAYDKAFDIEEYPVPVGFTFVRWNMEYRTLSDEEDMEALDEAAMEAEAEMDAEEMEYAEEDKVEYYAKAAKAEKRVPAEMAEAISDKVPAEAIPAEAVAAEVLPAEATDDPVPAAEQVKVLVPIEAGEPVNIETEEKIVAVHMYAVWEPVFKVIYHRVFPKSDFAIDKEIVDETYEKEYSTKEYKDAEGLFTVLEYADTGLNTIDGYEFDYWTMEWFDPYANQVKPLDPGITPRPRPEMEIEKEKVDYLEEFKVETVEKDNLVMKAAKSVKAASSADTEEKAMAEKAEVMVDKILAEALSDKVSAEEKDTVAEKQDEKENVAEKEDEKIMPGDEETLYPEVHLYAWWKEKPYTVIWIDWTKDGGSVENPLTTGEYKPEGFDPEKFDPEIEYKENKGPVREPKVINDVTYVFDHWELKESEDDHTLIYEAIYKAPYNVIWIDEGGDVKDPLTTGGYNEYDPETFDPAKEYEANKGPELKDKVAEDGTTYTFDHWEPKDNVDENTFVYEAAYKLVETPANPTNPGRPSNPSNPTTNTPAEDVSEIENNETPLAPATVDPVEDVDDEEVANNETPLAGFEVEPEEDDEIAEEATPLSPFTGDDRNTVVWGIVSILSLLGIVLVARKRKEE